MKILSLISDIFTLIFWNIVIAVLVLNLHEAGHIIFGLMDGCEGRIVIFDSVDHSTYSELVCAHTTPKQSVLVGGFLLTFAVGIILITSKVLRKFGLIVIGFSLIYAASDLAILLQVEALKYVAPIVGVLFVLVGGAIFSQEIVKRYYPEV